MQLFLAGSYFYCFGIRSLIAIFVFNGYTERTKCVVLVLSCESISFKTRCV